MAVTETGEAVAEECASSSSPAGPFNERAGDEAEMVWAQAEAEMEAAEVEMVEEMLAEGRAEVQEAEMLAVGRAEVQKAEMEAAEVREVEEAEAEMLAEMLADAGEKVGGVGKGM